jgi:hypothetical protein
LTCSLLIEFLKIMKNLVFKSTHRG